MYLFIASFFKRHWWLIRTTNNVFKQNLLSVHMPNLILNLEHILFAHFAILTKSEYLRDRIKAMESTVLNSSDSNDLKAYELQLGSDYFHVSQDGH